MSDESHEPFKRLFLALSCPAAQQRAIAQWRATLRPRSGRPVPAENFHLTLVFLGMIGVAQIEDVCRAAAAVSGMNSVLEVVLDRLEVWHRAGVLVLAPDQASPELLRLVYALEQAMLPFAPEKAAKPFRPHLTLMRDYRLPPPELTTLPEFYLRATHFTLYESRKGRYRPLAEWPLSCG